MSCPLGYIPERLRQNERPTVDKFDVGEELYYRVKPDNITFPYINISLADISHNRSFLPFSCEKDDVLYNILGHLGFQKHEDKEIVTLELKNLEGKDTYEQQFFSQFDASVSAIMTLRHDPVPCMYHHSVFELTFNGIVVTLENYKQTLGAKNKNCADLREQIRDTLTGMMLAESIDSSEGFEEIP